MKITRMLQDDQDPDVFWLAGRSFYRWNRRTHELQEFPHPSFRPNLSSVQGIFPDSDSTLLVGLLFGGIQIFNKNQRDLDGCVT